MRRRREVRRVRLALLATLLLLVGSAACSSDDTAADGRLVIATTVAPITSIVANIAGDRADVTGLVPEGTNSHTYEPKPSVAELLARADVVYVNGLQLEELTADLAQANLKAGAELIELGTRVLPADEWIYDFSFPKAGGKPNPHLWTDPLLARRYAEVVAEDLAERDPDNAAYYRSNLTKFDALITELDTAMRTAFATVPTRELLTYHDAYAYFAADYDWRVIGAIQVSDVEEPTPREVADLIDQIRAEQVPAIFGSEVFPSPVLEQIARETGTTYIDDLRDDDLPGVPGDLEHSWLGLMVFDFRTITAALGGDPSALDALEIRDVAPDEAAYPQ